MSCLICPTELLCKIFLHVPDPLSILSCRAVCSQFRAVIDGSIEVQYQIKLLVSGYDDNTTLSLRSISTRERLVRLEKHIASWASQSDWEETHISHLPLFRVHAYSQGIMAQVENFPTSLLHPTITITRFASPLQNVTYSVRSIQMDQLQSLSSVTIDPSQDLLVLVEV